MGRLREVKEIIEGVSVFLEPIPAALAVKGIFFESLDRTGFDAFSAFFPRLEKARLRRFYQGMISKLCLGDEAAQSASAAHGRNQHMVNAEPSESHKVAKVFMRPARHEVDFIKVVGGRS